MRVNLFYCFFIDTPIFFLKYLKARTIDPEMFLFNNSFAVNCFKNVFSENGRLSEVFFKKLF